MSLRQVRSSSSRVLLILFLAALSGCQENEPTRASSTETFSGKIATDWINLQLRYAKASVGFSPPVVSRAFGYAGLTLYESVVHGIPNGKSLVGQLTDLNSLPLPDAREEYHWGLCANAASARITRVLFENAPATLIPMIDSLESVYVNEFSAVPFEVAVRSIAFGREIADSIYNYSKSDGGHKGFNRNFPASYVPPAGPGLWQPTHSQLALLPYWGDNRTFIKNLKSTVTHSGFPPYSTDPASEFYAEASEVYAAGGVLTSEEVEIAYYWADEPFVTFTPPGHSMCIFSQLSVEEDFNLAQTATGFVKLGLAMSDAFVYCWKVKYALNLLRPSQYIQANIDPLWTPLIPNPPFPEFTSGHSTQSGAAARTLTEIFGENYSFTDQTHSHLDLGLPQRSFTSFYQMGDEAGISRIYAGIHFPSAKVQGRQTGYAISDLVLALSYTR